MISTTVKKLRYKNRYYNVPTAVKNLKNKLHHADLKPTHSNALYLAYENPSWSVIYVSLTNTGNLKY